RVPGLEDLDDAREAVRDVRARDAARVERPHGELGARLADRLRGDDPYSVADLGHSAGRQERAVAQPAEPPLAAALQHRADGDGGRLRALAELLDDAAQAAHRDLSVLFDEDRLARLAVLDRLRDVRRRDSPGHALVGSVVKDERRLDVLLRAAVDLADDDVLGHVDESAR